jgi:hypothetical protein
MKTISAIYWVIVLVIALYFGSFDSMAFIIVMLGFSLPYLAVVAFYYILKQL